MIESIRRISLYIFQCDSYEYEEIEEALLTATPILEKMCDHAVELE